MTEAKQPRFSQTLLRYAKSVSVAVLLIGAIVALQRGADFFVRADQRGQLLMDRGEYVQAAETFSDPFRQANAYYRAGDFETAASIFGGLPGAEAAYNQANALVMLGKYDDAVAQYDIALQSQPEWEAAIVNREIAKGRADRLKFEGGDMTGGQLGADEIVFDKGGTTADTDQTETVEGGQELSDQEMRAMWLRQVQTTPSDFLRAKFAYQLATKDAEAKNE